MHYFRSFYLNNSLLAHDPRVIMYDLSYNSFCRLCREYFARLGCIFLAGKTEETFVSVDSCRLALKTLTEEALFNAEIKVLEVGAAVLGYIYF